MNEIVECHSGYTYAERPVALRWEGERLEIAELLSGWRVPDGVCFRVCTRDERVFELCYHQQHATWQIHPL
jgi:hypothetical protein